MLLIEGGIICFVLFLLAVMVNQVRVFWSLMARVFMPIALPSHYVAIRCS